MQNLSFALGAANDMVRRLLELLEFIAAIEQQVLGDPQLAQGQVQARSFLAATALWAEGLRLDDQEIDVGTRPSVTACSRTKEDHGVGIRTPDFIEGSFHAEFESHPCALRCNELVVEDAAQRFAPRKQRASDRWSELVVWELRPVGLGR